MQYRPRIAAIMVYLQGGQFLPKKSTARAVAELFGTPVSHGTVATVTAPAGTTACRVSFGWSVKG